MEATDNRIRVINGNRPHIRHRLDLGSARRTLSVPYYLPTQPGVYIHLLDLVISHDQAELSDSGLDGVPASQTRRKVDVAGQPKVGGVKNLVCARVVENRLGVNAGLVGEGAETGDGVVEGGVD